MNNGPSDLSYAHAACYAAREGKVWLEFHITIDFCGGEDIPSNIFVSGPKRL
jgi:hypothetical protein